MVETTRMLAASARGQFFFVITTTVSTHCLVKNFHRICYWLRVNATWQYVDSRSTSFSKWPNNQMVAVVNHSCLVVQGSRGCRQKPSKTATEKVLKMILVIIKFPIEH